MGRADVDGGFLDILKATGTVPVGAQALLGGRHEVLQVLREVLVLVPEQVDLHRRLMDLRAVLLLRHPVPDPQHLHRGVVTGVHQVEEVLHELLPQEDGQLPVEALVVSQDHVQDHEEPIDGACVFQLDLHVQGNAGDGLAPRLNGEDAPPREDRPPERAILLIVVVYGGTNLLKKCLRPFGVEIALGV